MDIREFLQSLERDPAYAGQIVHVHTEPAREPRFAPLPEALCAAARDYLRARGVERLYAHQAEAVSAALDGHDVLVTTSAASGKSLCYQLPLLQALVEDTSATALVLFPAKALARDQVAAWNRGIAALNTPELSASAFDADSSSSERQSARNAARLLVTNPEMLHGNVMPGHARWARFFEGLRYVVIDELHVYTGFFGANMANVFRRLERVCARYGSAPRYICLSATVGNPREAAELVTGRALAHIADDASGAGNRTFVFWNPPRVKRRLWRGRRSANVEAHELMVNLVQRRAPTICFSKARTTAEMIYRYTREGLEKVAPALVDRVIPYRGGYSPAERRDMERRLREGEILGVSATRALELGIDIGSLDACIIVGYPGTLNAFFQQAGRVGRSGRDSLCILIGIDTPINQYIVQHPEFVFGRPIERTIIDRDNPFVVIGHVRCAAAEMPLSQTETGRFGYAANLALDVLQEAHKVKRIENSWYHASPEQPAHEVRLRGYGDESTVVMDAETGKVIDRLDKFRSLRLFYPGAIYFHHGDTYAMLEHDTDRNTVLVRKVDVSYYTDPYTGTSVDHIDRTLDTRPVGTGTVCLGEVYAVLSTPLYQKVPFYSMDRTSVHAIDLPNIAYEAMSFWLEAPPDLPPRVARLGMEPSDGMKGILYCVSRVLPLFLTSDANDFDWTLGCRNSSWHTMFWFEFYLQGIGHAEQCFERMEEILAVALDHLLTCDCEDGCPNCTSRLVTPYHVRNIELGEGTVHSRKTAIVVLNSILTGQSAEQSLALLSAPRDRGMIHLPTITGRGGIQKPHAMPVDDRLRALMLRKLERTRHVKEAIDHPIDYSPPSGLPRVESAATLPEADSARRSATRGIHRKGDPLVRRLQKRLDTARLLKSPGAGSSSPAAPLQDPPAADPPVPSPAPSPCDAETAPEREPQHPKGSSGPDSVTSPAASPTIRLGDNLASRARRKARDRRD